MAKARKEKTKIEQVDEKTRIVTYTKYGREYVQVQKLHENGKWIWEKKNDGEREETIEGPEEKVLEGPEEKSKKVPEETPEKPTRSRRGPKKGTKYYKTRKREEEKTSEEKSKLEKDEDEDEIKIGVFG